MHHQDLLVKQQSLTCVDRPSATRRPGMTGQPDRSFDPGQKVLAILPFSDKAGAFCGREETWTYHLPSFYSKEQALSHVLHVNLLKEWIQRVGERAQVLLIHSVKEKEEVDDQ